SATNIRSGPGYRSCICLLSLPRQRKQTARQSGIRNSLMAKQENNAEDIKRYSLAGVQSIHPDDLDRFKWYGLYPQRPQEDGLFMLRVKIPNGLLNAEQLETIGWLSRLYARSTGDITTRQGIQFHNVRIEDVPHIFSELAKVGLTTQAACG